VSETLERRIAVPPQYPHFLLISRHSLITRLTHWARTAPILAKRYLKSGRMARGMISKASQGPVRQPLIRQEFLEFPAMLPGKMWRADFRDG
jgi:hypothetical protein